LSYRAGLNWAQKYKKIPEPEMAQGFFVVANSSRP